MMRPASKTEAGVTENVADMELHQSRGAYDKPSKPVGPLPQQVQVLQAALALELLLLAASSNASFIKDMKINRDRG